MEDKKFEELLSDLESIVKELENGNADLDTSINKYAEAMKIAKVCGDKLNSGVDRVNKILLDNGKFEDFKIETSDN